MYRLIQMVRHHVHSGIIKYIADSFGMTFFFHVIWAGVLNLVATLASQSAPGRNFSFVINIIMVTVGFGLFLGLSVESCD